MAENGKQQVLIFEEVNKSFGAKQVLQGLSLEVRAGETMVVLGPSGCGKSVLLKLAIGLLRPDGGPCHERAPSASSASPEDRHGV